MRSILKSTSCIPPVNLHLVLAFVEPEQKFRINLHERYRELVHVQSDSAVDGLSGPVHHPSHHCSVLVGTCVP